MRISDWSSDVCSSDLTRVGEQIVEGGAAGRGLKAVNATEATIVEQHEDQFDAHRNRGGQLRIEHQIAAVANHDIDMARGLGELDANTAGDLIAHARIAVFDMIAAAGSRRPRSEEHTSELQSLMRISYAVFCLK